MSSDGHKYDLDTLERLKTQVNSIHDDSGKRDAFEASMEAVTSIIDKRLKRVERTIECLVGRGWVSLIQQIQITNIPYYRFGDSTMEANAGKSKKNNLNGAE